MIQHLVHAVDAADQAANIMLGVALQDSIKANAVGNSANDERSEPEPRLRAEPAVDGLLESVGRVKAPRCRGISRLDQSDRRAHLDGATVSHPRLLSGRCRAATLCVVPSKLEHHESNPRLAESRA